ncbi:glycosyltransferase [Candidatus Dojkabacteria bacterium]|nr:glycosyltransferase [Candidatus Dojkabacteria bacterium]
MKDKILFVIQRYGADVHGGAEWHCRQIAEKLTDRYKVEVATTKAQDYTTWRNHYKKDIEELNNVLIRRFQNDRERAKDHSHTEALLRSNVNDLSLNVKWIIDQGPVSSELIEFLKKNHHDYKKVIIFQYLYTISYFAMKVVPAEKIIFVPLAHDEPQVRYPVFRESFRKPEMIVFNSEIEKNLATKTHFIKEKKSVVAGVGIDTMNVNARDITDFKEKYGVDNYLIFLGRIDPAKRVDILINDFILYKKNYPSDLKLVLVGRKVKEMTKDKDVVETGYVSEKEKYSAIAGCTALVNPSPYESLSLIVLEAFFMKRPIIVNAFCEVLKYHCLKSDGGLWYETHLEFDEVVNYLLENPDISEQMGKNGYKYVKEHYAWDVVMEKWYKVLEN